jgi:mRNA interferase RelE/StbE
MSYKIVIEMKAQKEASKIPHKYRSAIDQTICALSKDPRPRKALKLTDLNGYRIRTGNYRILYTIDDEASVVVVYRIKIRGKSTYLA